MPTRRTATASAPQFLRVDKHLSKYTKALNQHLERPIQWGEEGAKHTKGLILVAEAQPAAEISVPNRVAQEHAARAPPVVPGSAAHALVDWWVSTIDSGAGASAEAEKSDAGSEPLPEVEGVSTTEKRRRVKQQEAARHQRAGDHYSLVVLAKAFDALKYNREIAEFEKAELHKNRLYFLDAALVKHEVSRLGSRSLKLAAAHARTQAAPLLVRALRTWCAVAKEMKAEADETDDELAVAHRLDRIL